MSGKREIFLSFGMGILFGGSLTFLLMSRQLAQKMHKILSQVSILELKLDSLKLSLPVNKEEDFHYENNKNGNDVEEDDIFEEACNGFESDGKNSAFYQQIDNLLNGNEDEQYRAHELLKAKYNELEGDVEFMWHLCKSTFLLFQIQKQKDLIYEALKYAESALELDNASANAHKWYAITLGCTNDFENMSSRIQNGYRFKEHIERAIILNPKDPSVHYLLGRWCYSVYMLSWIERKVATSLFASPPRATIDESLNHFLKANKLNPVEWKENMLFIAKCYIEKKDIFEAVRWLKKAKDVPVVTHEDSRNQMEIEACLKKYTQTL